MAKKKAEYFDENVAVENDNFGNTDVSNEPEKVAPVTSGKSKREIILETIEAGGATMETLVAAAQCKYESVMSCFSMLRLMGKCPIKDVPVTKIDPETNEEKQVLTYRIISADEWAAMKADQASNAKKRSTPARTPEERLAIAQKRVEKLTAVLTKANERANADQENSLLQLRAQVANLELQIAQIELDNCN